jgi:DHA1 family tetracycline resistance protein-like MFS transporter
MADRKYWAIYTLVGAVLIDSIGFGIIIPVLPDLIADLAQVPTDQAAALGGWLLVAFAATQFLAGPIIGNLSDQFGRRPVILGSMLAFGLDYALMALAPSFAWLVVGRVISGLAGAIYGPANAYIADVAAPEDRPRFFGLIGAAFGIGFIIGPALGGLLGLLGPRAPFLAAALLALVNATVGFFVLTESLAPSNRRAFVLSNANPLGAFRRLSAFKSLRILFLIQFLWLMAHQIYPSTWAFFAKLKFDWSPGMIGLSLAYVGVVMTIVQVGVVGPLTKRLGERRALMLGLSVAVAEFVANAFVPVGWGVFVILTLGALEGLVYPSMSALLTSQVPASSQGELQGGLASVSSITEILAPFLFSQILSWFSGPSAPIHLPGAAFLVAAGFAAGALLLVLRSFPAQATPT